MLWRAVSQSSCTPCCETGRSSHQPKPPQSTRQEAASSSRKERRPREGADDGADLLQSQPLADCAFTLAALHPADPIKCRTSTPLEIAISRSSRRNHEARRQKGSHYRRQQRHRPGHCPPFISEGAEVAITGRDQQTLEKRSPSWDRKAHGYRADVTVGEDRKKLFAELAKDFGKLDIVFANAGISGRTPTGTTDEAIFEKVVHTNLNGAFFTVNSAAPLMNDNGSIILSGSVHTYLGQPGVAAYAATKGGLVSMARSIAADLAHSARFA